MLDIPLSSLSAVTIGSMIPTAISSAFLVHDFGKNYVAIKHIIKDAYVNFKKKMTTSLIDLVRYPDTDNEIVFAFREVPFEQTAGKKTKKSNYTIKITLNKNQGNKPLHQIDFKYWENAENFSVTITDNETKETIKNANPLYPKIIRTLQELCNDSIAPAILPQTKISEVKIGDVIYQNTSLLVYNQPNDTNYLDSLLAQVTQDIITNEDAASKECIEYLYETMNYLIITSKDTLQKNLNDEKENLKKVKTERAIATAAEKHQEQIEKESTRAEEKHKPLSKNVKTFITVGIIFAAVAIAATITAIFAPVLIPLVAITTSGIAGIFSKIIMTLIPATAAGLAIIKTKADIKRADTGYHEEKIASLTQEIAVLTNKQENLKKDKLSTMEIIDFIKNFHAGATVLDLKKHKIGDIEVRLICQNLSVNKAFSACTKVDLVSNKLTDKQIIDFISLAAKTDHVKEITLPGNEIVPKDIQDIAEILQENFTITAISSTHNGYKKNDQLQEQLSINNYLKTGISSDPNIKQKAIEKMQHYLKMHPDQEKNKLLVSLMNAGDILRMAAQTPALDNSGLNIFIEKYKEIKAPDLKQVFAENISPEEIRSLIIKDADNKLKLLDSLDEVHLSVLLSACFPQDENREFIVNSISNAIKKTSKTKDLDNIPYIIYNILLPDATPKNILTAAKVLNGEKISEADKIDADKKVGLVKHYVSAVSNSVLKLFGLKKTPLDIPETQNAKSELKTSTSKMLVKLCPDIDTTPKILQKEEPGDLSPPTPERSPILTKQQSKQPVELTEKQEIPEKQLKVKFEKKREK